MDRFTPSESPRRKMSAQANIIDLTESKDENEDLDDFDKALLGLDRAQQEDKAGARIDDIEALPDLQAQDGIANDANEPVRTFKGSKTVHPSLQSNAISSSDSTKLSTSSQKALEILASARPEVVSYMGSYYTRTEPLAAPQTVQTRPRPPQTVQPLPSPRRSGCPRCEANGYLLSLDGSPCEPLECSTDCHLDIDEHKVDQTAYIARMEREFTGFENPKEFAFKYAYLTKEQIDEIIDEDGLFPPRNYRSHERRSKKRKMDESEGEPKAKCLKRGRTDANENLVDQTEIYYPLKQRGSEKGEDGSL